MNQRSVEEFFRLFRNPTQKTAVWYTSLPRIKFVCRMNGLSIKQSGRIVTKVSMGRMTANQVLDHISELRRTRKINGQFNG